MLATASSSFSDPTVFVALIGAFGGLAAIVLASVLSQRNQKIQKNALVEQTEKITEIHVLVNSKMDAALKRVEQLEAKLGIEAGGDIPGAQIVTPKTPHPGHESDTPPETAKKGD